MNDTAATPDALQRAEQQRAHQRQSDRIQARTTDPGNSVWVSANAGSGKTYQLSRRVIRLMLEGARPSQLLCLTFTKAAAAEMSNRVFGILGEWTTMSPEALGEAVAALLGRPGEAGELRRARMLFALSLDTPGGLRIQTIHAFCEALLHQFALEANVPGHFEMLGDPDRIMLLAEARRRVELAALGLGPPGPGALDRESVDALAAAFETVRGHASEDGLEAALTALIQQRHAFRAWLAGHGDDIAPALAPLWQARGLDPAEDEAALTERIGADSTYDAPTFDQLRHALRAAKAAGARKTEERIERWIAAKNGTEAFAVRCELFLTGKLKPAAGFFGGNFHKDNPTVDAAFRAEQALLLDQLDRIRSHTVLTASAALFAIADAVLGEYEKLKHAHGKLDFDDLITRSAALLRRADIGPWVRYKLDAGISHVLVDEAQDTSPLQWRIIEAITEDFFSGDGGRSQPGTLFIVGDEKQSIYSFQGADMAEFEAQRAAFGRRIAAIRPEAQPFEKLQLSRRSTPEVLSAVDQVFSLPKNRQGLGEEAGTSHGAYRHTDPGEVMLWEAEIKRKLADPDDWRAPPPEQGQDAEVRLADRIAQTIRGWIDRRERLPGRERPIRHGDILILVRKRDRFVNAMNRKLKEAGLKTAGADRLKLTDHIAIEDLLMLGRFAATPIDDLALAGILKSPLFGFDETELFELAHGRKTATLFGALEAAARSGPQSKAGDALRVLNDALAHASGLPVFEFYARLFARHGWRRAFIARHGHEVEEVLDGFFEAALDFDRSEERGLQAFVENLLASEPELKREIEIEADEIRVITVHSSKGLEAPIVFLVDPGNPAVGHHHPDRIAWTQAGAPLWIAASDLKIELTEAFFDKRDRDAEAEYRRLLYVGMTRAADRLIVCGYASERNLDKESWLSMVKDGLEAEAADRRFNGRLVREGGSEAPVWHWRIDNRDARERAAGPDDATLPAADVAALPGWLSPVAREIAPPRPLTPSGVLQLLDIEDQEAAGFRDGDTGALARGTAIHHLLQLLPEMRPTERRRVIERYFAAPAFLAIAGQLDSAARADIAETVLALLDHPDMAPLLGEGSRAEMEVIGKLGIAGAERLVRGQVDRIAVSADRVIIADYKSGRGVPPSAGDVPAEYVAQMALYRELVRRLYPGRRVDIRLVWTAGPVIMELPDSLLDTALARINTV